MPPVKILHLHSSFDVDGKQARSVRLINHFGGRAEHTIISGTPDKYSARTAIAPGVKVDFPQDAPSLAGRPSVRRFRQWTDYMRQFHLVLTYNWGAMDAVMARTVFARQVRLPPLIHHEDGCQEDQTKWLKPFRNWYRMVALARADALVVQSHTLETVALKNWHQPESRVVNIPDGVDLAAYAKTPQRGAIAGFRPRANTVVIGSLAGLRPGQNLPLLVRSVASLKDDVQLVIVGEGPEGGAIRAEAERTGLADNVLMPGLLKNPARFIGLFDIFALSSESEQFPISVVEAMAAGLPIVAPRVGDIAQMVSNENRALLFDSGDEAGLTKSLARLITDPELRATVGAANRRRAEADYGEQQMLDRYMALYGRAMRRLDFGDWSED